ncbi:hypothetical protein [Thermococcus sp.]|uniref:hypothetical protein n=1 Tax=Thermococcus sp. TaxID=35749 RepID=UPI00260B39B7|nr:hypothetical protein [Thermococcus sp.]
MPTVTIRVNVPDNIDPEELRRLLELELVKRELGKRKEKPKGDFRKLKGILGKADLEELQKYELEAEFGDLY